MPRPKSLPDEAVLDAALQVLHARGPDGVTFAAVSAACNLSGSTLVQRFGTKSNLVQATILHAWDQLDETTRHLAETTPRTPDGAVQLLVGLSNQYGAIENYAEGLLILREDLRDPLLRARGRRWKRYLCQVLDECFSGVASCPDGIGLLMASQWQGSLLWWAFDPKVRVETYVEDGLKWFVTTILGEKGDQSETKHPGQRGSFV